MVHHHEISARAQATGEQLAQQLLTHAVWRAPDQPVTLAGDQSDSPFSFSRTPAWQQDKAQRLALASLQLRFLTHCETRLASGHHGPMGFDVGSALADLLINYCGLPGLLPPREAADAREQRLSDVHALWDSFAHHFVAQFGQHPQDEFAGTEAAGLFLQQVWTDAIGYCAVGLLRRSAGAARLADFCAIRDDAMRADCVSHCRTLGSALLLAAPHIADADALIARIRQAG